MSLREVILFENRQKAVRMAQDFLSGRIGLEASERLALLYKRVGVDQSHNDFLAFIEIHRDATDGHRHWTAEALDAEIASFEAEHRNEATKAASNLVKRSADEKTPQSDWM
jgi:hypothetical protein